MKALWRICLSDDDENKGVESVGRSTEGVGHALEIERRWYRHALGVGMPVPNEVQTLPMPTEDLALLSSPVGHVRVARAPIGPSWPSRFFNQNLSRLNTGKQLTSSFPLVPPELAPMPKVRQNFIG